MSIEKDLPLYFSTSEKKTYEKGTLVDYYNFISQSFDSNFNAVHTERISIMRRIYNGFNSFKNWIKEINFSPFSKLSVFSEKEEKKVLPRGHVIKNGETLCVLKESPFRILRVAESGNLTEFTEMVNEDPSRLKIRDAHSRNCIHQATVKNRLKILEYLHSLGEDLNECDDDGNSAVHLAVEYEALEALDFLLSNGGCATKKNGRDQSPLHIAAEFNKARAMRIFSNYKSLIDITQLGELGRNPLHFASIYDHDECIKILLFELGADPRVPCMHGFYPIHDAAKHASSRCMEVLLAWGDENECPREQMMAFYDSEGNVPLHSAVHGGEIKAVELCILSGAKISIQQYDLSTPIHLACTQGSLEMVKLMFALQEDEKEKCLRSFDLQRMTPLHCAAMFDHHHLVEYLVSEGAPLNVLDKEKRTPLHLGAFCNGWKAMRELMRLGANIKQRDSENRSILHVSIIHGIELDNIIDSSNERKFDVILNEKDKDGLTPLHWAARQGQIKNVSKLIELGASALVKSNLGENSFHFACRYGRVNIIKQMLDTEAKNSIINEGDGKGKTPLHIASLLGHVRVVQLLLNKGALLHRDHMGRTILHLATKNGHINTMKIIMNVHSHLLDQVDKDGNTALHLAAMENEPKAVQLLLNRRCKLLYNENGMSALDYAIENKFLDVALAMVTHSSRSTEILSLTGGRHPCVMLALIATMPKAVSAVLDNSISKSTDKNDSELYHICYDFKFLSFIEDNEESYDKAEKKKRESNELPILNGMVSYGREELLCHVLSQKYLEMKWNAYAKHIHFAHLTFYIIFLTILTLYSSAIAKIDILNTGPKNIGAVLYMAAMFIFIVSTIDIFQIGFRIHKQKMSYFRDMDSGKLLSLLMNISTILMAIPNLFSRLSALNKWEIPMAAVSTFLAWFYLLLVLQSFDLVGIFVVMFLEILNTLIRVLTIFSILIIAFGLSFFILLAEGKHLAFGDPFFSLLRTFSMMLGDLDVINTFVNPDYCYRRGPTANNETLLDALKDVCRDERVLPYPITSFLAFGAFMVLMPILLMNLLIGLAVGDIESVRRNAKLKRLAMQVHQHTALEKSLPKFILMRVDKNCLVEYPNAVIRSGIFEKILSFGQPKLSIGRNEGNEKIKTESFHDKSLLDLNDMNAKVQNIESLIRMLCHKMNLKIDIDFIDEGPKEEDGANIKI